MEKIVIFFLSVIPFVGFAQVGIGTVAPDSNAILDLRNTNNRGLVLPRPVGNAPGSPEGVMYYSPTLHKMIYLEDNGYNAISPWRYKFNGSSSNNTYYIESGNVGVGTDSPQRKLHVKSNGESIAIEGSTTGYISFYPKGYSNGRKAYIGHTSSANGDFTIKNVSSNDDIILNTSGSGVINTNTKIHEYGNILLPAGAIVMWSGSTSTIPSGWALCNGSGTYQSINGTNYSIPDLRGKFIVAYDNRESSSNSAKIDYGGIGNTGGENEVELDLSEMPRHNHSINDPGHSHSYRRPPHFEMHSTDDDDNEEDFYDNEKEDQDRSGTTGTGYTGISIKHTGGDGVGSVDEDGEAHENRPEYYVLAFIIKTI